MKVLCEYYFVKKNENIYFNISDKRITINMKVQKDPINIQSNRNLENVELSQHLAEAQKTSKTVIDKLDRLVSKDGKLNVLRYPVWNWFNPFSFSNLIGMQWFSFNLCFAIMFGITFYIFGLLFYFMEMYLGDCFHNVNSVAAGFLFAFETAQTIGYGSRYPHQSCPEGVVITLIYITFTTFLATLYAGCFLAKFSSTANEKKVVFSQKALITKMNGHLYLVFRVADPVESQLDYGAECSVILVVHGTTLCKHRYANAVESLDAFIASLNFMQVQHLKVGFQLDKIDSLIPLMWPICIYHKIDRDSPFYKMGPEDIAESKLEVIVTIHGSRSSGGIIKSMSSYTTKEIVWGARFDQECVLYKNTFGNYIASFAQEDVDRYQSDNTPKLSAKQLERSTKYKK